MSKAKAAAAQAAPEVFAQGYLLSAKGPELLKRLGTAFGVLKALEQQDNEKLPAGLENVASALLAEPIVASKSKDVRLLACCCIVEVLRIYAPTPPYQDAQLQRALEAVIASLPSLATRDGEEASFERAAHILESLATVRSCVIVAEIAMAGAGAPHADALLVALFDALLGAMQPGHARRVEEHAAEVLCACLDEVASIGPSVLCALLDALLDRAERPRAADLAATVLSRCADKLDVPIGQAVSGWIEAAVAKAAAAAPPPAAAKGARSAKKGGRRGSDGTASDADGGDDDDDEYVRTTAADEVDEDDEDVRRQKRYMHRDTLHRLILELAAVVPAVLTHILPTVVSAELEDGADASNRLVATALLGRLWALPKTMTVQVPGTAAPAAVPLGRAFDGAFASWCRRFRDREPGVRAEAVKAGGEVLRSHEALAPAIAREMAPRLRDEHDEVRLQAVIAVCDCACGTLPQVPLELLQAVADRGRRDKRFEIRREAVTGLAQAYAAHVPGVWQSAARHAAAHVQLPEPAAGGGGGAPAAAGASPARGKGGKRARTDVGAAAAAQQQEVLTCASPGSCAQYPLPPGEAAVLGKLAWVPSTVMAAYDHPEPEMRLRVVQLLDHIMLPENLDEPTRARGALALYSSLDADGRRAFRHLLRDRAALQRLMAEFLSARAAVKAAEGAGGGPANASEAARARERLRAVSVPLAERLGPKAKALAALHSLATAVPDNRVFRALGVLADPCASAADMKAARDEVTSKIKAIASTRPAAAVAAPAAGGKRGGGAAGVSAASASDATDWKSLQEVLRALVRRMAQATLNAGQLPAAVDGVAEAVATGATPDADAGLQLLGVYAELFPGVFAGPSPPSTGAGGALARGATGKPAAPKPAAATKKGGNDDNDASVDHSDPAAANPDAVDGGASAAMARLCGLLNLRHSRLRVGVLRVLAAVGGGRVRRLLRPFPGATSHLRALLLELAVRGGSPKVAKHAVAAAVRVFPTGNDAAAGAPTAQARDQLFVSLASELAAALAAAEAGDAAGAGVHLPSVLAATAALAQGAPALFAAADVPDGGDEADYEESPLEAAAQVVPAAPAAAAAGGRAAAAAVPEAPAGRLSSKLWALLRADEDADDVAGASFEAPDDDGGDGADNSGWGPATASKGDALMGADDEEEAAEDDEEDGDEDNEDAGFARSKKGKGGKGAGGKGKGAGSSGGGSAGGKKQAAGAKRKRPAAASSSSSSAAATSSVPDAAALSSGAGRYKGLPASQWALVRAHALRALAAVPRGLATHLLALQQAATGGDAPAAANAGSRGSSADSASPTESAVAKRAAAVSTLLADRARVAAHAVTRVLEFGGDLVMPRSAASTRLAAAGGGVSSGGSTTSSPLRSAGRGGGSSAADDADAAVLRLAAAVSGLRLAAAGGGGFDSRLMSVPTWQALVLTALDASAPLRWALLRVAGELLRGKQLPMRYALLPAFMCADTSTKGAPLRRAARETLAAAMAVFRMLQLAQSRSGGGQQAQLPYAVMPEFVLPFAVFALGHDPLTAARYPGDADVKAWSRRLKEASSSGAGKGGASAASADDASAGASGGQWGPFASLPALPVLTALVDAILHSLPSAAPGADTDVTSSLAAAAAALAGDGGAGGPGLAAAHSGSLSLLFAITGKLKEVAGAAAWPAGSAAAVPPSVATRAMHAAADLAFHVLKARARDQAAFARYPGEVRLPLTLFRAAAAPAAAAARSGAAPSAAPGGKGTGAGRSTAAVAASLSGAGKR